MKNLRIKPFYNSSVDDILEDFYNPVLSKTKIYKRVSAYFDSNIISMYSKGIENIVDNNGHIYFVFSSDITERDFNIIKNGYKEREKLIEDLKSRIITETPTKELKNLGYLIKNGFVDIKIAFTKNSGIFHDKFGICENNGESIYFRGSNNETVASILSNFESFETTSSWQADVSEKSKIDNANSLFDLIWNNNYSENIIAIDIPDSIKNELIKYSVGRLIYNYDVLKNTIIIDYKDRIIIKNNLDNKQYLSPSLSFYKRVLEHHVDFIEGNTFVLKETTSYIKVKRIISLFEDWVYKIEGNIHLTKSLLKFIEDKDIQIEKRRSLGISIKERFDILEVDFNKFRDILENEMNRKLREPQLWDAYHIVKMMRSANFSVPGSGKTSIVYGAFAYLQAMGEVDKIVMIGPINSFSSWKDEFLLNFGNKKKLDFFDYQQEKNVDSYGRYGKITIDAPKSNLILFNYESIQTNVNALKNLIDSKTLLVFDEVHRIKSVTGLRASAALKIGNNARYRVVLTGTPIPNGYIDLYNMINLLFNDEYETFFPFDQNYLIQAKDNYENRAVINNTIYPFFCRTNKDDLNVPKAEPDNIDAGYSITTEDEEELFEIIYRAFSHNILTLYIRLIQASNNPKLIMKKLEENDLKLFNSDDITEDFTDKEISRYTDLTDRDKEFIASFDMTSKFRKGVELVLELVSNGKVIVWGIFIDTINRIKKELNKHRIKAEVITGSTPLIERERIINCFVNGELEVLITNPHTLGESVSLHKNCHQAVYFEYSFNLVHMLQSRDRIHRLGLSPDDKTNYYYLMLDNPDSIYSPIDRKIYNRLTEKEEIQSDALSKKDIEYNEEDIKDDIEMLFGDILW